MVTVMTVDTFGESPGSCYPKFGPGRLLLRSHGERYQISIRVSRVVTLVSLGSVRADRRARGPYEVFSVVIIGTGVGDSFSVYRDYDTSQCL